MQLIDQNAKRIMEQCKERAIAAGLQINSSTLEYIVSNQNMNELRAKAMIPTLYDFWVDDVEVIRDKWMYDADPHNPYETVINTRPAISFYNDNNPDWLNAMIFYHVLGHIDFFQNNIFFKNTWNDDFCAEALADKRLINRIRQEQGENKRWVDYVIEFSRGIDNLVGYYQELEEEDTERMQKIFGVFSEKMNYYLDTFIGRLRSANVISSKYYYDEIERYNRCVANFGDQRAEEVFFADPVFRSRFPEFDSNFEKHKGKQKVRTNDILLHLTENSDFLDKSENRWMKDVLSVVRRTSLYFQPQIRTKIANEGWASHWHETLFLQDERLEGHRIGYARTNSDVLVHPRIGMNPYIIGMLLYEFIEDYASRGKLSYAFQLIKNMDERKRFNQQLGGEYGKKILFETRRNFNDHLLVNFLSDDDFQVFMEKNGLFVAGIRPHPRKQGVGEVYVKTKSAKEYRREINKTLYHPPNVVISEDKGNPGDLYLDHVFEGRMLVTKYIKPVLTGIAFLAKQRVVLETTEVEQKVRTAYEAFWQSGAPPQFRKNRIRYFCEGNRFDRTVLEYGEWEEV